jgi:Protein of unknown function (DUF3800)
MMTISCFMDESGKFSDSEVVVMTSVIGVNRAHMNGFATEWATLLKKNGLEFLKTTEALKLRRPLSAVVSACDLQQRIEVLRAFILCIRKYLQMVMGVAIDVREYAALPDEYRGIWGNNPIYTAFARGILEIVRESPQDGLILLYCDDEEETALPFYKLYRKIKNQYADARLKLRGISFVDDQFSFPLQATDLVASLVRQEALFRFRRLPYDFQPLFAALEAQPSPSEAIGKCGVAWCDREQLIRLGKSYKAARLKHRPVRLSDLER